MPAYTLDQLKADVASGTIDTVLVAFPDMQGRLIGKRFQAEFFLEGAIDETHGCDYLLADDIDMEPVPGYAAANWGKGYGDFVMKPDLQHADEMHLARGHGAGPRRSRRPPSPRADPRMRRAPSSSAQLARLEQLGLTANFASELEFYLFDESFRIDPRKGLPQPQDGGLLHRGLPHLPDHQGRRA